MILALIMLAVGVVQYVRGFAGETRTYAGPNNTAGPAEGGAMETGGAVDASPAPAAGEERIAPRDRPRTVASTPPEGPSPAPSAK